MIYTWATATDTGLVRDQNEDSVAPRDMGMETGRFVVGVADGMGGHRHGEVASDIALEAALETDGDARQRVRAANRAVVEAGDDDPDLKGMGTTLTLAVFDGTDLEIGHVGDSRAYLLRGGELEQLTTDHSLVAEMVARGDITADEAAVHPYRSVITRAIGLQREVEIDRFHCRIEAGDRVLLCSDGLTGMVPAERILEIMVGEPNPTETVWSLIEAANEAGGVDTISVVVVAAGSD